MVGGCSLEAASRGLAVSEEGRGQAGLEATPHAELRRCCSGGGGGGQGIGHSRERIDGEEYPMIKEELCHLRGILRVVHDWLSRWAQHLSTMQGHTHILSS